MRETSLAKEIRGLLKDWLVCTLSCLMMMISLTRRLCFKKYGGRNCVIKLPETIC